MQENFNRVLSLIEELTSRKEPFALQRLCQILKEEIYHYDWVGFYVLDPEKQELILGPFAGKPTEHTRIAVGKGVCGQVAESGKTMMVQDVTQESNYIACSLDVQSEIVVPVLKDGRFVAELDIDSHSPAPFTGEDVLFLEKVCSLVQSYF